MGKKLLLTWGRGLGFSFCIFSLLSACDENHSNWKAQLGKTLVVLLGEGTPGKTARPSSGPSEGISDEEFASDAAKSAKANAEILKEMLQVILMREPKDRAEFGNWADTLNQGASIEGVYNGLTHCTDYRKLEVASPAASVGALKAFGEELAALELELPIPTEFDSNSAAPLPTLGTVDPGTQTDEVEFGKPTKSTPTPNPSLSVSVLAEKYSKQFVGASIFILKRVLSDEALKVIAAKNQYKEKLATWYSKWVVRIAQRNVDFGVALRNKPDEVFHYQWAVGSSDDRIKWEVLNRLHRVLNDANRLKQ